MGSYLVLEGLKKSGSSEGWMNVSTRNSLFFFLKKDFNFILLCSLCASRVNDIGVWENHSAIG